ncbi:MAG: hypothetical protein M3Q42_11855 [Pseudomonadota bacterium]|nr:hypothetical protein [Pseudomonadota bacterium]
MEWHNFHDSTTADFAPCATPRREPDYISGSGSRYWNTTEGVIREADHWGGCRRCMWLLAGDCHRGEWLAGFCRWRDFHSDAQQCAGYLVWHARWRRALDERIAASEAAQRRLADLVQPGRQIAATRTVTERVSSRKFAAVTETVVFVLAKITARFYVAADGRRFARHTLSGLAAAEVAHD